MTETQIKTSFQKLRAYCKKEKYKGWDPYDGMNSKLFQLTPLKNYPLTRLMWIQLFKRNPINLRKLFLVPKQYNAKGISLFLNGYCNLYRISETGNTEFGTSVDLKWKIDELAKLLISLQSKGHSHACWGYNFDWQARRLFLFPKHTPTVVATNFCATALFAAYEITKNETYLQIALSAAEFVMNDLNRTPNHNGFLFSYSPLKGNDTVINASLLGAKVLSYAYHYTKNEEYINTAKIAVATACKLQSADGSWVYGLLAVQSWIDSFHTGYNLDAIIHYQKYSGDFTFKENIDKGFEYYMQHFFEENGTPKYYHNKTYPIDIHCPGQLLVTLSVLDKFKENEAIATKTLTWTIKNMQDKKGYFYYQMKKLISSKISYMRWSNGFMFNAFSYYFLEKKKN